MAYDLRIERDKGLPIALDEWHEAIKSTEGVRIFADVAQTVSNPKNGNVISINARNGDAEVLFPDGVWRSVFRWRGAAAVFVARFDPTETSHPVWRSAVAMANRLNAMIRGDEGEIYDLKTGEVIDA